MWLLKGPRLLGPLAGATKDQLFHGARKCSPRQDHTAWHKSVYLANQIHEIIFPINCAGFTKQVCLPCFQARSTNEVMFVAKQHP